MSPVLIVDDDEAIRSTISLVLEDADFVCHRAANGEDALRLLCASTERMVVVLDWMMPYRSGIDVLDAVDANPYLVGRHRFIMLTAAIGNPDVLDTMRRRGITVIPKPFELDQLVEAVADAANRLAAGDNRAAVVQ